MEGTIQAVKLDRSFGFIAPPGEPDIFFHKSDLDSALAFDEQLTGRRVRFVCVQREGKLQARKILPAD